MSMTALFAELVIIGLQAAVWMMLILMAFVGPEAINLDTLSRPVVWLPLLAFIYVIGIAVDRAIDRLLFRRLEHRIRQHVIREFAQRDVPLTNITAEWDVVRLKILSSDAGIRQVFDYNRSRARIMRASCINGLLITIGATYNVARWHLLPTAGAIACATLGLLVSLLCLYAWAVLASSYNHMAYRVALKIRDWPTQHPT